MSEELAQKSWTARVFSLRSLGSFVMVVLGLLLVGGMVFLSLTDWNQYRDEFADVIENRTGLRMTVDDNLTLRLLPRPALSATRVTLSTAISTPASVNGPVNSAPSSSGASRSSTASNGGLATIATIERLDMVVALGPLLRGDVAVRTVVAAGVEASLVEDAQTGWQIEGLPQAGGLNASTEESGNVGLALTGAPASGAASEVSFGLDQLELDASRFTVKTADGRTRRVIVERLSLQGRLFAEAADIAGRVFLDDDGFDIEARVQPGLGDGVLNFRTKVTYGSGEFKASGRYGGETLSSARLQVSGTSARDLGSLIARVAGAGFTLPVAGDGPVVLDASIDENQEGFQLLARQARYGQSAGRVELAYMRGPEGLPGDVSGTVSFSVLDMAPVIAALSQPATGSTVSATANPANTGNGGRTARPLNTRTGAANGTLATSVTAQNNVDQQPFRLPFGGTVRVSVEALQVGRGLAQQLSADLGFLPSGIRVDQLESLLPGAARITARGLFDWDKGAQLIGDVTFKTGRLREMADWVGVALPQQIGDGRLSTLDATSWVRLAGDGWRFDNIDGQIDSIEIQGSVAGRYGETLPTDLAITLGRVNFDAYGLMADTADPSDVAGGAQTTQTDKTAGFCLLPSCLGVEDLSEGFVGDWQLIVTGAQARGFVFQSLRSSWIVSRDRFALVDGEVRTATGAIGLRFEARRGDTGWSVVGDAGLDRFDAEPLMQLTGLNAKRRRALALGSLSGELTVSGPLERLDLVANLASESGLLNVTGRGHLDQREFAFDALQGTATHVNAGPLFSTLVALPSPVPLPAEINMVLERDTTLDRLRFEIGGRLGDMQIASNISADTPRRYDIRFDAPRASIIETSFDLPTLLPGPDQPTRLAAIIQRRPEGGYRIDGLTVRNGNFNADGALSMSANGRLSGDVRMAGVAWEARKTGLWTKALMGVGVESIRLSVPDATIMGQDLALDGALLIGNAAGLTLDLGSAARLNGAPLNGLVSYTLTAVPTDNQNPVRQNDGRRFQNENQGGVSIEVDAARLDLGGLTRSVKAPDVLLGQGRSRLTLSFDLSRGWRDSLEGSLSLSDIDGALQGVDVAALGAISTSGTSGFDFVSGLNRHLSVGQTPITGGAVAMRATSGILLLENTRFDGAWGRYGIDGRISLPTGRVSLEGAITVAALQGGEPIGVSIEGLLMSPETRYKTEGFMRQGLLATDRRGRAAVLATLDRQDLDGKAAERIPGRVIFERAAPYLAALAQAQAAKRAAPEATDTSE